MTNRTWLTMLAWGSMKSSTLFGVATICILISQRAAVGFDDSDATVAAATATASDAPADGSVSTGDKTVEKTVDSVQTVDSAAMDKTAEKNVDNSAAAKEQALSWLDDYSQAMKQAKDEKKLMLIHFYRAADQQRSEAAEAGNSVVNIERA